MNYNNKIFKPISNTENGETSTESLFYYHQEGNLLSGTYSGGNIAKGQLIGVVNDDGKIDMRYQQVNIKGELRTGICLSIPEILDNGKIRLHEKWQWTSGDRTAGSSILEEC